MTLNNPARSAAAPSLPNKSCKPLTVVKGLRVPAATPSHTTHVASIAPAAPPLSIDSIPTLVSSPIASTSQVSSMNLNYEALQSRTHEPATSMTEQLLSRERVTTDVLRSVPMQPKKKPKSGKPREGRTCRRCGIHTCPGKKSVNSCKNPCQDCGRVDCPGRNPKRPKRTCSTAWIGVNVDD